MPILVGEYLIEIHYLYFKYYSVVAARLQQVFTLILLIKSPKQQRIDAAPQIDAVLRRLFSGRRLGPNFNQNTTTVFVLLHLNEPPTCLHLSSSPPTCESCALHWSPKYHTGAQREFQGQENNKQSKRCLRQSLRLHENTAHKLIKLPQTSQKTCHGIPPEDRKEE